MSLSSCDFVSWGSVTQEVIYGYWLLWFICLQCLPISLLAGQLHQLVIVPAVLICLPQEQAIHGFLLLFPVWCSFCCDTFATRSFPPCSWGKTVSTVNCKWTLPLLCTEASDHTSKLTKCQILVLLYRQLDRKVMFLQSNEITLIAIFLSGCLET